MAPNVTLVNTACVSTKLIQPILPAVCCPCLLQQQVPASTALFSLLRVRCDYQKRKSSKEGADDGSSSDQAFTKLDLTYIHLSSYSRCQCVQPMWIMRSLFHVCGPAALTSCSLQLGSSGFCILK